MGCYSRFDVANSHSGEQRIQIEEFMKLESLTITIEINKSMNSESMIAAEKKWNGYLKACHNIMGTDQHKDVGDTLQTINDQLDAILIERESNNTESGKVYKWLNETVGLPQYYDIFIENGFDDMEIISEMTVEHLKQIGIDKIGHQTKILKYAQSV